MNQRHWFFGIVVLVIVVLIILYFYLGRSNLGAQVLDGNGSLPSTTVDNCHQMSEIAANECFLEIAIQEQDESVCDEISKASAKQSCKREVQLAIL